MVFCDDSLIFVGNATHEADQKERVRKECATVAIHQRSSTMPTNTSPNDQKVGWFQNYNIIKLNIILLLSMISSYTTGFDGSMMSLSTKT